MQTNNINIEIKNKLLSMQDVSYLPYIQNCIFGDYYTAITTSKIFMWRDILENPTMLKNLDRKLLVDL